MGFYYFIKTNKISSFLFGLLFALFMLQPFSALAIVYQPGETLNPACAPTDASCGVAAPITASSTSAFSLGGAPPAGSLFYVAGTSTLQNIIPAGNLQYSIGSPESRLQNVYTNNLILGSASFVMEDVGGVLRFRDVNSVIPGLVIDPSSGATINGNIFINGGATFANATTTGSHYINALVLGGKSFQNLVGVGLKVASSTLALDNSGDWTGTFDGQEASYYLANAFSTSSANSWLSGKTTNNLTEGGNLYYTDARARSALSVSAPLSYSTSTGAFSIALASGISDGIVSTTTQTFAGEKTFSGGLKTESTIGAIMTAGSDGAFAYNFGSGISNSLSRRVSQSSDDAEQSLATNGVNLTSSDLELINDSGVDQEVGIRFQNITIPQGATITNAYIEFTADGANSGTTNLNFYGEAADNAVTFTTATNNITGRTKTSFMVAWSAVPAWTTIGQTQQTPTLAPLIQEIVNRVGWLSGNSLVIIINGTTGSLRRAVSYNGGASSAALLVVQYTTNSTNVSYAINNLGPGTFRINDEFNDTSPFIVDSSGNVGIGTASPGAKLDVRNNDIAQLYLTNTLSGTQAHIGIGDAGTWGANNLVFSDVSNNPRFVVDLLNGNVGIGASNPGAKLHVVGISNTAGFLFDIADIGAVAVPFKIAGTDVGTASTVLSSTVLTNNTTGGNQNVMLIENAAGSGVTDALLKLNNADTDTAVVDGLLITSANGLITDAIDVSGVNITNAIKIGGNLIVGNSLSIDGDGSVGIGTTAPAQLLHVARSTDGVVARFTDANGDCDINPTNVSLACASDISLKKNVLTLESSLKKVLALNPVTFNWRSEEDDAATHLGFIAQEVEELFPALVSTNEGGLKSLAYGNFTPILAKAVQELFAEVEKTKAGIASLADSFKQSLVVWFADASNGIRDFFAQKIHTEEVCLKKSDGSEYCVNGDNLEAIMLAPYRTVGSGTGRGRGEVIPPTVDSPDSESLRGTAAQTPATETSIEPETDQSNQLSEQLTEASALTSKLISTEEPIIVKPAQVEQLTDESIVVEPMPMESIVNLEPVLEPAPTPDAEE